DGGRDPEERRWHSEVAREVHVVVVSLHGAQGELARRLRGEMREGSRVVRPEPAPDELSALEDAEPELPVFDPVREALGGGAEALDTSSQVDRRQPQGP